MVRRGRGWGARVAWVAWVALGGCPQPGPFGHPPPPPAPIPTPSIASFDVDCDVDAGAWTVDVEATAWTGGGVSLWSTDLVYLERHVVLGQASAEDGSSETLGLTLGIVSDWRRQTANVSTVFTCADEPSIAFSLLDVDGAIVDCRFVGPLADALAALPSVHCGQAGR